MSSPRLADWILRRVLPLGKRGESILGDLREEYRSHPSRLWYWRQTIALAVQYLTHDSPQSALTYPRSTPMWFDLRSDLRTAFRMLQRNPGTSMLIVATLALAIGAATIGFAFADLALFRGLPVDDTSRVVSVFMSDTHGSNPRARVSAPELLDFRARSTTLVHLSGMREGRMPWILNGQSRTLTVSYATANVLTAMGQRAFAGRTFMAGDDANGAPPVALLSHRFWRDEFQSRPDAIGATLQLGKDFFTVVGVLSPDMEFGNLGEVDLWVPLALNPAAARDARNLRFIARLKDGVTFEQAAAEMDAIGDALASEHPLTSGGWTTRLVPISDITGGQGFWVVIFLFLFSIGLLIAIATANVSNLIMVRAAARARELAVRTAMGARGGRLMRQFIVEGFVLAALGAALAVPAAWAGLQAIAAFSPEPVFRQLQIDWHELSFVASLALICPMVFSLASARLIARPDLRQVLASQGGRGTTATMKGRSVLVVAQVALAVIMLTATLLAARSIRNAFGQPIGMSVDRLLTFTMEFNDVIYPDPDAAQAAVMSMRDTLAALPGVSRASLVSALPVLGDTGMQAISIDNEPAVPNEATPTAVITGAAPDAPAVLGVPLTAGRWWSEGESGVAVITDVAASRYFGGRDRAIGRHVSYQSGETRVSCQVIGVSGDVANTDRTAGAPPRLWVPLAPARRVTFIVESDDPSSLPARVRMAAAGSAAAVPIEYLNTLSEAFRLAEASDHAIILTLGGFALVALLLATSGLFGVMSYSVSQRTAEFGTRMALGAPATAVVAIVARQSMRLLGLGLLVGLGGGVGVGFLMRGMLFGISPADPITLAGIVGLLCAVSLIATALPAWRASRIDPVIALRSE